MAASAQFYIDQAALCAISAEAAPVGHQRDKYLRAESAWQALADREEEIKAAREKRDAEKAARDEGAAQHVSGSHVTEVT